jgi:putative membrane protein
MDKKVPRRAPWQREGKEPDYRFSLANERTFLAWIRTALAILAGGILLDQFSTKLEPHIAVQLLAISLCVLAGVLSGAAYRRWIRSEIAMRHAAPLPYSRSIPLLSAWALAVAAVVTVLLAIR